MFCSLFYFEQLFMPYNMKEHDGIYRKGQDNKTYLE